MFLLKKNSCLRFCVDCRHLNAVLERYSYRIPKINGCIDSLGEARVFSTINANSGYRQLDLENKNVDKTASVTRHGLFRYTTMPFGLKNAPAWYQRAMDVKLAFVKCQLVIVFIDDIINFSKSPQQHL